jgi:PAS domain S-box-containing protein
MSEMCIHGAFLFSKELEDFLMATKPTYEDLEQRVKELEKEAAKCKSAEEALEISNERITNILESISDGFFTLDQNLVVTHFNKAAEKLLDQKSTEVLGRNLFAAFPEAKGSIFEEKYTVAVKEKRHLTFEVYFGVKPYENWYEVRVYPYEDGISVYFQVTTERKQAQGTLLISEQRYRDLYENAPNAYFSVRATDGSVLRCNSAAQQLLGYDKKTIMGMKVLDLYADTPYGKPKAHRILKRFRTGESIRDVELQMKRQNGAPVWISLSIEPVRDDAGSIVESRSVVIDISERKQAEGALKRERDLTSAVLTVAGALVVVLDREGRIVRFNKACEKLTGHSFQEVKGRHVWDLFLIKEEVEPVKAVFEDLRSGQFPNEHENYWLTKDSSRRLISWSNTAILDREGSVEHVIGTGIDITESKQAEEALRESEERYRRIVNTAQEGIWVANSDAKVTYVNQRLADMLGYSVEETLGSYLFDFMDDLSPAGVGQDIQGSIGNMKEEHDFRFSRKDGSKLWGMVSSTPIFDDGKINGALGMIIDVTQRKRAGDALRKSSEAIKLFAYSVAHDLKSPAIGVYGLTKRLRKQYGDILDEKGKDYCNQILEAAEQIAELVSNINVYISTREISLKICTLELSEILQMVREEFSTQLDIRQVAWKQPDIMPEIRGDRLSILRILRNLVDNALKYGGDELTEIKIGYEESDQFHIVSVSDDGVGVTGHDVEKLFGAFQRQETSRSIEGIGMGLAIVKELAEQQGGTVRVEPGPEKRTIFYVSISKDL